MSVALKRKKKRPIVFVCFLTLAAGMASAENASNPLASVSNLDTRVQYTYADPVDRWDVFLDGAQMLMPTLKLKYELHYNFTDATGSQESDFERLVLKPIYFPSQTKLNEDWGLKTAVGLDNATSFLRGTRSGTLRCTARPLHRGRRSHVWEGEIHDDAPEGWKKTPIFELVRRIALKRRSHYAS